jgi:ATP-dependent DNA helicase RecQ
MIKRLVPNKLYNPIRSHIKITFSGVKEYNEKYEIIADDLINNRFDINKSRVLIFVSARQRAEDAVEQLSQVLKVKNVPYWDKVEYYHAGLEGAEREERLERYISGEILLLIATKAFGMGMDIPNVHFIYHLDPSSNFEDFLQEVGRAGRKKDLYLAAGFSENNPIKTNCIIAKDDFKSSKDRLHGNEITWGHIVRIQKTVYDYANKFSKKDLTIEQAFALPTDLLSQYTEYSDKQYNETFFRVVLYWLERLNKIKLGTYTVTCIPLTIFSKDQNFSAIKNAEDVGKIKNLYSNINSDGVNNLSNKGHHMVPIEDLKALLQVDNIKEVWRLLFLAQKAGVLNVEREMIIAPTIKRKNELGNWDIYKTSPTIDAAFAFTKKIMYESKYNQQTHFQGEILDSFAEEAMQEYLIPSRVFWKEFTKKDNNERSKDNIAKSLQDDFIKKRAKVAFNLINFSHGCKHKSILQIEKGYDKPKITQLVFNGYKNSKDWEFHLDSFKKDLYALIKHVHNHYIKHEIHKYNIVDLLLKLNLESKGEDYFNQIIFVAKGLGYLKGNSGGLVPMGMELFILEKNIIDNDNLNEFEKNIKAEFDESNRMKVLRLLSLECLASHVKFEKYDEFIKAYFQCATETDFVKLLEEHLGENNELLNSFRAEALKKAIVTLNEEQCKVYNAPIGQNLQVIAGPGSGKTHTLTLRVARLIQDEKINPENILVLAYNRAVVVELKDRLNRLFKELGYAKLIKRLKVFTFHGFCKYALDNELDGLNFDQWTTKFIKVAKESPGKISQKIGLIKHLFVDEFQDITNERLDLLQFIAKPSETTICVIGDPNQSIYGFDRINEGGEMSPLTYYNLFDRIYLPKILYLNENRRSYQQIIDNADELLALNASRFEKMPKMKAFHGKGNEPVCELFDLISDKVDWKSKFKELIDHLKEDGKHFKDIALMFRSNIEVYRAYNEIKKMQLSNVRIRVQGASGSLSRTREFYYFLCHIKNKGGDSLPIDYFENLKQFKQPLLAELPNWDEYLIDVFLCIAYEYKKEIDEDSTYEDLYYFIMDISNKDDGQYGKIYAQNIHIINYNGQKTEIVLTTMHKVKGIEYDAVLIPASLSNFGINQKGKIADNLQELYEEERRLYYVAYTRAKYKLVVIKWKKENALYSTNLEPVEIFKPEQVRDKLGILMEEGIDKFILYWGASSYGRPSFNAIKTRVQLGDDVTLTRRLQNNPNGDDFHVWEVLVHGTVIARLSSNVTDSLEGIEQLNGFIVSSVYVHTYEETLNSETGKKYADKWTEESKNRGFIYLIDFSGYGKKVS